MCASCFSSADSFLMGSAGAVAVADFVRTLGLDPDQVLGPPPADDDLEVREPVLAGA